MTCPDCVSATVLCRQHMVHVDPHARIAELEHALELQKLLTDKHAVYWHDRALDAEARLSAVQALVDEQSEDEGLWFCAETAPEDYLQLALRRLHAVIESAALSRSEKGSDR